MKKFVRIALVLLLSIAVMDGYGQKKKRVQEVNPLVKENIESKNYKIRANTALPTGWRSVSLDSRYSVEVRQDSVFSNLPYYGRAYRLPYGGGEGLIFDAPITDYKVKDGKKGAIEIEFKARTREDSYRFLLTIYPNGNSSIKVFTDNRQSIDFIGEMLFEEPKK